MEVKFLIVGDPHIQVSNIKEVELFLDSLINLATEKKPDRIILLGDLLHNHERIHTIALNKAYQLVNDMRLIAKTYILVGNHDYISNQQYLTDNHWMNGLKEWDNTIIVDQVITETINGNKFVFAPYVYPGRFIEALNTLHTSWQDADCIFAHQEFAGCKMGAITSVEGDNWSLENPNIISGHIHSRQMPQPNIYYPGAAMQHAFGESKKNIISFATFNNGKYTNQEIDLKLPRKKTIYLDVEDIDQYVLPTTKDTIKLTVSGNYEQFKALKRTKKYKELTKKGTKIVFKPKKITHQPKNSSESTKFTNILKDLIIQDKNPYLCQVYELIVNNKTTKVDDIMFL